MATEAQEITLELTRPQAIVLFALLARVGSGGDIPFEDLAEQQVLWRLEAQLEKSLTEPLAPNYAELVAEARRTVRMM